MGIMISGYPRKVCPGRWGALSMKQKIPVWPLLFRSRARLKQFRYCTVQSVYPDALLGMSINTIILNGYPEIRDIQIHLSSTPAYMQECIHFFTALNG